MEWDWLHFEEQDGEVEKGVPTLSHTPTSSSGYASPSTSELEEERWSVPSTPPCPMFDGREDEVCGETIRREDKLGVLSLRMCLVLPFYI